MRKQYIITFLVGALAGVVTATITYAKLDQIKLRHHDEYIANKSESIRQGIETIEKAPSVEWSGHAAGLGPDGGSDYWVTCCEGSESALVVFSAESRVIGAFLLHNDGRPRIEWLRYDVDAMNSNAVGR